MKTYITINTQRWDAKLYSLKEWNDEHLALLYGEISQSPLIRIQSECVMWDVFGTNHCSCKDELHASLDEISQKWGIVFYLRQEWMWVGLEKKIQWLILEEREWIDEYEAYKRLWLKDCRSYWVVTAFLKEHWITDVVMKTGNSEKITQLESAWINVSA